MYSEIRQLDPEQGWSTFRRERDFLHKTHAQSPLSESQRERFEKLEYFPYDSQWRLTVPLEPPSSRSPIKIDLGEDGDFRITEIGQVWIRADARLSLFWVEGYGGGLFLPFADGTNGETTYGGGRYLLDGIKGADLGMQGEQLILDFNFAYNPSCVYDDRWVCPLPPEQNCLPFEVAAGEKAFRPDPK
jgi:hypothetical protein